MMGCVEGHTVKVVMFCVGLEEAVKLLEAEGDQLEVG